VQLGQNSQKTLPMMVKEENEKLGGEREFESGGSS